MGQVFARPPVVIGHRGSGKGLVAGHAENTIGSFAAALDAGLEWLEADVRTCGDSSLVVAHGPTSPDGRPLADLAAADARAAGVLLLDELLDWLPEHIGLDIDLKASLEDATRPPETTTGAVLAPHAEAEHSRRPLLVTSFDPAALLAVRRRAPSIPLGLLTWFDFPLREGVPAAAQLGFEVLAAHVGSFESRRAAHGVQVARQAGLELVAWSPANEQAPSLIDAGVDAVIVDDAPGVARALADRTSGREQGRGESPPQR